ncbi:hypothetical protein AAE026_13780 [Bradyrhizobium sp. DN5]|uniref:hypothetical protein n=1 Tax=Bradyrhizobium sp. DN5 TaxID=3056950 RepID=UPI0035231313
MTGRTCNISARYAGSAIAAAELRIAVVTCFSRTLFKQKTALSGQQRASAHGVVVAIRPAGAETSLDPRADGMMPIAVPARACQSFSA